MTSTNLVFPSSTVSNIVNADVSTSAAIAVSKLANGTSNQLLGTNSGATANEFKALSVANSGTDFSIAHGAGTIFFNLPDASTTARGVVSTGSQFIGGDKTFTGILNVSNSANMHTLNQFGAYFGGGSAVAGSSQVSVSYRSSSEIGYICSWGSIGGAFGSFQFVSGEPGGAITVPMIITGTGSAGTDSVKINGKFSCNGVSPVARPTVNAACSDLATAIALINQLRTALINTGIVI